MSDFNSERDNENTEINVENIIKNILEGNTQDINPQGIYSIYPIIWFILKKVYWAGYWDGCKDPCCHYHYHHRDDD